jgi:predicted DNA-binding transcriptional regulator AlpA
MNEKQVRAFCVFRANSGGEFMRLVKAENVALILDVTKGRVYELVRENFFPQGVVTRVGKRQLRFNEDALLAWIAHGGTQPLDTGTTKTATGVLEG